MVGSESSNFLSGPSVPGSIHTGFSPPGDPLVCFASTGGAREHCRARFGPAGNANRRCIRLGAQPRSPTARPLPPGREIESRWTVPNHRSVAGRVRLAGELSWLCPGQGGFDSIGLKLGGAEAGFGNPIERHSPGCRDPSAYRGIHFEPAAGPWPAFTRSLHLGRFHGWPRQVRNIGTTARQLRGDRRRLWLFTFGGGDLYQRGGTLR